MSKIVHAFFFAVLFLLSCEQQSLEENDSLLTFLGLGIDDTEAPVVTQFTGPATTTSSTVPVSITATDNIHISRWMITESATPPAPTAPGWRLLQPSSYTITSGYGTYELYLWARDGAGNVSALSADTHFAVDYTGTADGTPPVVSYFANTGSNPTNSSLIPVDITATDDVGVTGYIITETAVTPDLADPGWSGVQPASYAISTGYGTYELYVWARDLAGNVSLVNANSHFSITYADLSSPTVTVNQAGGQPDPTNTLPIEFTVTFSKAINTATFTVADITQSGTVPPANITWNLSTSDNITWTLRATAVSSSGTVIPSIAASVVQDTFGYGNIASTSSDNTVSYDITSPTVTVNQGGMQDDPTRDTPVIFTVVFSKAIDPATFDETDISQSGTVPPANITWNLSTLDYITWTLMATSVSSSGTVVPDIAAGMVQDPLGNNNTASTSTDNTVTYDIEAPSISMFTGPATTNVNNISVGITAGDNVGITGWIITETATAPLLTDSGWQGIQPGSYVFSGGPGAYWLYLWARDGAGNISAMSASACFLVTYQSLYPAPPLRTGQTGCYDETGTSIACAGTGQDGDLTKGLVWPLPRFTVNGLTVTDNLTGLVWTTTTNLMASAPYSSIDIDNIAGDGAVYWQTALDYAAQLRTDNYGGRSDWRLPNIVELMSVMNFGSGLIRSWFTSFGIVYPGGSLGFWSSTSHFPSPSSAWLVRHYTSYKGNGGKTTNTFYAWAVAGTSTVLPQTGQTLCYTAAGAATPCAGTGQDGEYQAGVAWVPATRFVDNLDGTITDDLTGLMWVQDVNAMVADYPSFDVDGTANDGWVTWQHALDYVAMLNSGAGYLGYTDWRLPNVFELLSLQNHGYGNSWLYDSGFNSIYPELPQAQAFWSSTTYEVTGFGDQVKIVNDVYYNLGSQPKSSTTNYYTWPVRGGN